MSKEEREATSQQTNDLLNYFRSRLSNSLDLLELGEEEIRFAVSRLSEHFDGIESVSPPQGPEPKVAYVLATTSRVGGHFVGQVLESTGAGNPKEFFSSFEIGQVLQDAPSSNQKPTLSSYLGHLFSLRSGPTGIFGTKASFHDIVPSLVFRNWPFGFARWKWIYLYRENIVDQAVSLYLAEQTGKWNAWASGQPAESIEFDALRLHEHIKTIVKDRSRWDVFFSLHGITPLRLSYEAINRDVFGETQKIRAFLNLNNADLKFREQPLLSKQATTKNAELRRLALSKLFGM